MAYVSTIVSGAACLGVLLGLISGIFFLVLAAVKWMSKVRSSLNEKGIARQKKFLASSSCLLDSPAFPETRKTENNLGGTFNGSDRQGIECNRERGSERPSHGGKQPEEQQQEEEQRQQEPSSDTVRVREVMEKMVETMIGGPLDGTTVGQLSTHPAYEDEDSSHFKESNLKRVIKQVMAEAMELPGIKDVARSSKTPKHAAADDVDSKSYEDILATAILNKVIESFQNKSHEDSKAFGDHPKPRVRQRVRRNDVNSDGDWSDTSRSDQLSLTIEEYIEEVTTGLEASEDERSELSDCETSGSRRVPFPESGRTVVDAGTDDENSDVEDQSAATELVTSNGSWEENWLFQKKRLRSTPNAHHPVPVPMLVPNPSEEFRALVGGVDADELSDMSECSDFGLEEPTAPEAKLPEKVSEEEVEESGNRKLKVVVAHITEEVSPKEPVGSNSESNGVVEADDECSRSQTNEGVEQVQPAESLWLEDTSAIEEQSLAGGPVLLPTSTYSEDSLIRCRVAQREKEKWTHPVPLPDNPYSLENIEKREQQRRMNQYFRIGTYTGDSIDFPDYQTSTEKIAPDHAFTRDYYVNASKHPSGMSSPPREPDQVSTRSHEPSSPAPSPNNPRLYPDIADGSAEYFPPHRLCPLPPISSHQHFSQVFKTSAVLPEPSSRPRLCRRYRYGSHTLKLRPNPIKNLPTHPSLHQQLSQFERQSLRADLTHSLLRARDASPNFILNPVYNPDPAPFALPYHVNYDSIDRPHSDDDDSTCRRPALRTSRESGYGSDSLDHSSDSLECWRLTPPKTPEVVESSLVSIVRRTRTLEKSRAAVRKSLSSFH